MKNLMFAILTLTATVALAADYSPSAIPTGTTSPDVMPGLVNFQGLLREPSTGVVYSNGIYSLECRLYSSRTGGTALWGGTYKAYVKDGYFNIMLGDSADALTDSGCAKPTDLWKVLWYNGANRELYLGVTPWQKADGTTITDANKRTEISPRQQLLAAPFAFRAQKAQYADAASGAFKVAGDLTVSGQILNGDGSAFGLKNVTSTATKLSIGESTSSPANTLVQGGRVSVSSGSTLAVNPGTTMSVNLKSGRSLTVNGNSGNVYLKGLNILSGYADYVYMGWDNNEAYGISVSKGAESITATADCVEMRGKAIGGETMASLAVLGGTSGRVQGFGDVKWKTTSGAYQKPFLMRTLTVTLPANSYGSYFTIAELLSQNGISGITVSDYKWAIVGYEYLPDGLTDSEAKTGKMLELYAGTAGIALIMDSKISKQRKFNVHVMGINGKLCD